MPDKKPVTRSTHDWGQLKAEFMAGPWLEVVPFAKERLGSKTGKSGWYGEKMKGWTDEKAKKREKLAKKAMQITDKEMENELTKALNNIRLEIVKRSASPDTQVRDLNVLWNMLRVENGMPTTIAKNENRNHDESLLEKEGLNSLLNKAKDANASGQPNATNKV